MRNKMSETQEYVPEAVVDLDAEKGIISIHPSKNPDVKLTLTLPKSDEDGPAFDWIAGNATVIIIAALNQIVQEVEKDSV
jgi:hypothetical protein